MSWITVHRGIKNHWIFREERKYSKFEAWMDLLLEAYYEDGKQLFNNQLIQVNRGQQVTSIRQLCRRWGWSNRKVLNFLSLLEEDSMIKTKSIGKASIITLVNYEVYQHEGNTKASVKHHPRNEKAHSVNEKSITQSPAKDQSYQEVSQSHETEKHHQSITHAPQIHPEEQYVVVNNVVDVIEDESEPENNIQPEKEKTHTGSESFLDQIESNDDYDQVQNLYLQRAGKTILSSSDMTSISGVMDNGKIPLKTILDGINQAFDNYKPRYSGDSINSFSYCVKAIRSLHHQLEQQKEWNQRKKRKRPPAVQPKPDQQDLPEVFRQNQPEAPKMSEEELKAMRKAMLEKLKIGNTTMREAKP